MEKLKAFIKTTLLGGFIVVLPVAITIFALKWIFNFVTSLIQPLTNFVITTASLPEIVADIIVIAVILIVCFTVGFFVRTQLGGWIYRSIEKNLLMKIPGFSLIKETVIQFADSDKSPFSSVALVQIFGNDTLMTAFVTDTHDNGSYSVFVPTGPNPTSGNIYHVEGRYVHPINVSVEDAMRSIISCGTGSDKLVRAFQEKTKR